jgi:hypothetical protein
MQDDRCDASLEFPIPLGNRGVIELDIVREVCEEDLSSRQNEHVSDKGTIDWRVRWAGNLVQMPAVPLACRAAVGPVFCGARLPESDLSEVQKLFLY